MLPMTTAAGPGERKVIEADRCQFAVVLGLATETTVVAPSLRLKLAFGELAAGSPKAP